VAVGERALVTTLTKRMAEDLADFWGSLASRCTTCTRDPHPGAGGDPARSAHGGFDVVVGINLLREGLDLPEVSLVAILDADKEGFLRSDTSLIQTIGRAARHVRGQVVMYADRVTDSMRRALDETDRRRSVQQAHNEAHGIEPQSIVKQVRDLTDRVRAVAERREDYRLAPSVPEAEVNFLISELEKQMKEAASNLEFEKAALLRDQIFELRKQLEDEDVPEWERIWSQGHARRVE
jgi:excinuclease ABC subunit B